MSEKWREQDADCSWPGKVMEGSWDATEGGGGSVEGEDKESPEARGGRGYTCGTVATLKAFHKLKNIEHS